MPSAVAPPPTAARTSHLDLGRHAGDARTTCRDRRQGRPTHPSPPTREPATASASAMRGCGTQIAAEQMIARRGVELPILAASAALRSTQSERRVADRAGDDDPVPGFGAAALDHLAVRQRCRKRRSRPRPARRAHGVAAEQRAGERFGVSAQAGAKTFQARRRRYPAGNASVSRKPTGFAPLAARSDRFTRSALRAIASGGSSGKNARRRRSHRR